MHWCVDLARRDFATPVDETRNAYATLIGVTLFATEGDLLVEVGEFEIIGVGIARPVDLRAVVRGKEDERVVSLT